MEKEPQSLSFQPVIDRLPPADQRKILLLIKAGLDAGIECVRKDDVESGMRMREAMHLLHEMLTFSAPEIIEPVENWIGISMHGEIHNPGLFGKNSRTQGFDSEARFRAYTAAMSLDHIPQEKEQPRQAQKPDELKTSFMSRLRQLFRK